MDKTLRMILDGISDGISDELPDELPDEIFAPDEVETEIDKKNELFIFRINMLIRNKLNKKEPKKRRAVTSKDLFDFFGTNRKGIRNYLETGKLPNEWILKLSQTNEGIEILTHSGVAHNFVCPIENVLSEEVAITPEIVAEVDECIKELKKLSAESEIKIGENNISEGADMNAPTTSLIGRGVAIIQEVNRESFIAGLQSALKLFDSAIFNKKVGVVNLNEFIQTGVIPEEWDEIIQAAGGTDFLAMHAEDTSAEALVGETSAEALPKKEIKHRPKECELVSRSDAKLAIPAIIKVLKLKNKKALADLLDINSGLTTLMEQGKSRLRICQVEFVAQKSGLKKDEFFKAVGLEKYINVSQDDILADVDKPVVPRSNKSKKRANIPGISHGEDEKTDTSTGFPDENVIDSAGFKKMIELALFKAGGIPKGFQREFFLGYVVINFSGYRVEFLENENKIRICTGECAPLEFELGHIPFES